MIPPLDPESVLVHENEDGEEPLNVYAVVEGEGDGTIVTLDQGPDRICIPADMWWDFADRIGGLIDSRSSSQGAER